MMNIFKLKKINKTAFRKEVLAIFNKYDFAIPLSIVEKELKKYNRITLYRTIKIFLEKGIIHKISISGKNSFYAICEEDCDSISHNHQHIHFKCNSCRILFCVEMGKLPTLKLPDYKIEQLEIHASGLCQNCNV